jgi:hypothetical protein
MDLPLVIEHSLEQMNADQILLPNPLLLALTRAEKGGDIGSFTKACYCLLKFGKMGRVNSFEVGRAKMQEHTVHSPLEGHLGILPLLAKIHSGFDERGKHRWTAKNRQKWLQTELVCSDQPIPIH